MVEKKIEKSIEKKTTDHKKEELKYKLKLEIANHPVGMKPYVFNSFGHICEALISELHGITPDKLKEPMLIVIGSGCTYCGPEDLVKLQIGAESIMIKDWVQEMFAKTIRGFLTSLKDIPTGDQLNNAPILIELQKK